MRHEKIQRMSIHIESAAIDAASNGIRTVLVILQSANDAGGHVSIETISHLRIKLRRKRIGGKSNSKLTAKPQMIHQSVALPRIAAIVVGIVIGSVVLKITKLREPSARKSQHQERY